MTVPPLSADGARRRTHEAIGHASRGQLESARRASLEALDLAPDDPVIALAAGAVLHVAGDYHLALTAFQRAARLGASRTANQMILERANRLGWLRQAKRAAQALTEMDLTAARWPAEALTYHLRCRDYRGAVASGEVALARESRSPSLWLEVAAAHLGRGDRRAAVTCLERALSLPTRPPHRLEAARLLVAAGELARAEAVSSAIAADYPGEVGAHERLAELALWSARHDEAEARARRALQVAADSAAAHRVLGVLAWIAGRAQEARSLLERAVALDPEESEAHVWLAELAVAEGRSDDAHVALSEAVARARGYVFSAQLLRILLVYNDTGVAPHLTDHLVDDVVRLAPGANLKALRKGKSTAWRKAIPDALRAMHANRSVTPTFREGNETRPLFPAQDPRFRARRLLELIRIEDAERVLARFDELADAHPLSSLPLCHKGELLLWLGRLQESEETLLRAIAIVRSTRWAYIGLTTIYTLEGNPERALETSARGVKMMANTEGPAVFGTRGEALRRQGRLDEAIVDLERAVSLHRGRFSAAINLALAHLARGDHGLADKQFQFLREHAPGLLSDAGRELGLAITGDEGGVVPSLDQGRILTHALAMLRGNRSSTCVSYFTREGELRFVPPLGGREPLHERDRVELAQATALLSRWAPVKSRPAVSEARPTPPVRRYQVLTDDEVESFVETGHVWVRGCFDRSFAAKWQKAAVQRMAREPTRWLRRGPDALRYDPARIRAEDPRTWPGPVLDLLAEHHLLLWEAMPRLWGAITDLVGGPSALRTFTVSDHFVIKTANEASVPINGPDVQRRCHLDVASTSMRLDRIDHALTCVALFSDVTSEGGATALLPQSLPRIASLMAAHPEGVDLTEPSLRPRLVGCDEVLLAHGEVGDVMLVHSLIAHAGTANTTSRARWLGNPNIFLRQPMDPLGRPAASRSPVERAVVRAIARSEEV